MAEVKERKVVRTEHPHIVRVEGIRGGDEVIGGSRMAVWMVANHWRMGMSPKEIAQEFQMPLSHVFDALSCHLDRQAEIDRHAEEAKSFSFPKPCYELQPVVADEFLSAVLGRWNFFRRTNSALVNSSPITG